MFLAKGSNQDINQDIVTEQLARELATVSVKIYTTPMLNRMLSSLTYCLSARTKNELLTHIGLTNQTKNVRDYLEPLIECELLARTIPDSPTSRNQRYVITEKGKKLLLL